MTYVELGSNTLKLIKDNFGSSWQATLISAFAGAFFAFLFVKIGDFFTRIRNRKMKNHDTLVRLENTAQENLSIAFDNIFVAKDIIQTIEETLKTKNIVINFNSFNDIIFDNELLLNLLNIGLINEIFNLNIRARKINRSLASIIRFYNQINEGIFAKTIDIDSYRINLEIIKDKLGDMIKFVESWMQEDKKVAATIRVLMRKKRFNFDNLKKITFYPETLVKLKDVEGEVNKELEKLEKEIEEISKKSQERIDAISKK